MKTTGGKRKDGDEGGGRCGAGEVAKDSKNQ
jgi:hypothetical protein